MPKSDELQKWAGRVCRLRNLLKLGVDEEISFAIDRERQMIRESEAALRDVSKEEFSEALKKHLIKTTRHQIETDSCFNCTQYLECSQINNNEALIIHRDAYNKCPQYSFNCERLDEITGDLSATVEFARSYMTDDDLIDMKETINGLIRQAIRKLNMG